MSRWPSRLSRSGSGSSSDSNNGNNGNNSSNNGNNSSKNGNNSNTAFFECNICFELAEDPIVTLCGHIYCWACLYRWLHHYLGSQECPLCKAPIQEGNLIPMYGRGKVGIDQGPGSIFHGNGIDIPNRPTGQRPETAAPPPPELVFFSNVAISLMVGEFAPMPTDPIGNVTLTATFSGLLPALFNLQEHGRIDGTVRGGYPSGSYSTRSSSHANPHYVPQEARADRQRDYTFHGMLYMIAVFVLLLFI